MMPTILVLDDYLEIAELICVAAGSLPAKCQPVGTLAEFFSMLTPETSVILMDMRMPEITVQELLVQLAARRCETAIVLMSGAGSPELERAVTYGRQLGLNMKGTLDKPFRVPAMLAMLRGALKEV